MVKTGNLTIKKVLRKMTGGLLRDFLLKSLNISHLLTLHIVGSKIIPALEITRVKKLMPNAVL